MWEVVWILSRGRRKGWIIRRLDLDMGKALENMDG